MRRLTKRLRALLLAICWSGSPAIVLAGEEPLIQWHSSNVQLLKGFDYKLGAEHRTIGTFEYANGWRYGDLFIFVDYTRPDTGDSKYYAEVSPRFSISKITGLNLARGIVKDVLVSTTLEKPQNRPSRQLYGLAVDLLLLGFDFFNTNLYIRDNPDLNGDTWQVTLAWKRRFSRGNTSWLLEGFADFSGAEEGETKNQLIVPRLLLDTGQWLGIEAGRVWAGLEYSYWHNKFGVDGVVESVPQLQLKLVF